MAPGKRWRVRSRGVRKQGGPCQARPEPSEPAAAATPASSSSRQPPTYPGRSWLPIVSSVFLSVCRCVASSVCLDDWLPAAAHRLFRSHEDFVRFGEMRQNPKFPLARKCHSLVFGDGKKGSSEHYMHSAESLRNCSGLCGIASQGQPHGRTHCSCMIRAVD